MLYPEIDPYHTGFLNVDSIHTLYYEESGLPNGVPILFLHGGPGSGTDPNHRRYFDPTHYRIILFDQRGCGKSLPHACITQNTTFDLVEDIEKLRVHLQIQSWIIFGGSWGSLLALTYSTLHPQPVLGLILRGLFFCIQSDFDWFFKEGAPKVYPDHFEKLTNWIDPKIPLIEAYYRLLQDPNPAISEKAARYWAEYEAKALKIEIDSDLFYRFFNVKKSLSIAKIETHYFYHKGFFPSEHWLFDQLKFIQSIPMILIHGRYDMICPVINAWNLKKLCPLATLRIIEGSGHSGSEPRITEALIEATNQFKEIY